MATAKKWSNVAVAMQSAIASAATITGITTASPGVATSTAHGYTNGDYVLLEVQGMYQLNQRVFRVCSVATNTFQLEDTSGGTGLSTLGYSAITSISAMALFRKKLVPEARLAIAHGQMSARELEDVRW